jgi:hypothetical protein
VLQEIKNKEKTVARKKDNIYTNFSISAWIEHAKNDLNVAKLEIPLYIRGFHAQQATLTATSIPPLMATKNSPTLDGKIGG